MFNSYGEKFARVYRLAQYGKGFRSFDECIKEGTITFKNNGTRTIVKVSEGVVTERKVFAGGKYTFWVKYGEFEKERANGNTYKICRYRKGTSTGKDGLWIRKDYKLEGETGTCYTFFLHGRFMWQKFIYSNGVKAYYCRNNAQEVKAIYPNKAPMFHITGEHLNFRGNGQGEPFPYNTMHNVYYESQAPSYCYSDTKSTYVFYDKRGRVRHKGQFENKQRVGEWTEKYRAYFYLSGIKVDKKLYDMKPDQIDPYRVLREKNAQARAMLLKKIGFERVVKKCKGKIIHNDFSTGYQLIDFEVPTDKRDFMDKEDEYEEKHLRILKVICPSTKNNYFLPVPAMKQWDTCEKARQGTFNEFDAQAKPIVFKLET